MSYNRTAPDYALAQKQYRGQKAGLTRAINSGDPEKVIATVTKTVQQWDDTGTWPDAWHRWDIALSDAYNWARDAYVRGQGERPDPNRFDIENLRFA